MLLSSPISGRRQAKPMGGVPGALLFTSGSDRVGAVSAGAIAVTTLATRGVGTATARTSLPSMGNRRRIGPPEPFREQGAANLAASAKWLDTGADAMLGRLGQDPGAVSGLGQNLLSSVLGGGTVGTLAEKLQSYAGLPAGTADKLLGLAGRPA